MRRVRVPDSETDTPGAQGIAPRGPPPDASRARMAASPVFVHILVQLRRQHLRTPIGVRLLDWPDRRASTCDGAPRKCHKSVSSLCRSTTRLAASISAKWQLSFARASVPPPPLRQVVGPAVRAAGRGAVGGEGYRAVLVPTPKMRTAGASAPAVRTCGAAWVRAGRRWWPAAPSRPAPPRSSRADLR